MNDNTQQRATRSWPKLLMLPATLIAIVSSLFLARALFPLPSDAELRDIARTLFSHYGALLVFVSGLIEGLLLIGWYFPGTTVILFCLVFAANDASAVAQLAAAAATGLSLSYAANYALGRFGWYRLLLAAGLKEPLERARLKLEAHGLSFLFLSYWQFTLASLSSTAAGILRFNVAAFTLISTAATFFWVGFWSALIYFVGERAVTLVGLPFILALLFGWVALLIAVRIMRARRA
jgi:membrane protein DedA with SNARE-associated domain